MNYHKQKFSEQKRDRSGSYIECETCHKIFYVTPSRIRQVRLRGWVIRYCSRQCVDITGDKNSFWGKRHTLSSIQKMVENPNRRFFERGADNPNATRFGPEYVRWDKDLDQVKAIKFCEKCGFSDVRALQIHHIDRNRLNNKRHNLERLCANCHMIAHYEAGDGLFWPRKKKTQGQEV